MPPQRAGEGAHLDTPREGVARLYDCHAVRALRQAVQRQLLRPRLLQIAHHPQPVRACSSRSSIFPLAAKSNNCKLDKSPQLMHAADTCLG